MARLSQAALGERVGLTFQQVQKHEHGVVRISAGRLLAFAVALNVPVKFFFDGIEPDLGPTSLLDSHYMNLSDLGEAKIFLYQ